MIIKKYSKIVKAKVERKSLALKAKEESSDEECSTFRSEDEEYTMAICLGVDLEPDEWIKDSGCSKHMTGNQKLFSTYKAYNGGNVIFGSSLCGNIIGKGHICDNKCRVTLSEHDSEITKDGKVIASKKLVRNLPKLKFNQHFCDACKIGKQAHASHKAKNIVSTTRCLELHHMLLFGPFAIRSYGGNRYTLVIVDDYSRFWGDMSHTDDKEAPPSGSTVHDDSDTSCYETKDEEDTQIHLGPKISIKEHLEKDKIDQIDALLLGNKHFVVNFRDCALLIWDDESLRKWKEQLLGSVDVSQVEEVQEPDAKILNLTIVSASRPYIVLEIPNSDNPKGLWFTLKEEVEYGEQVKAWLESEKDIRLGDTKAAEIEILNVFQLLTAKPVVYLVKPFVF
nr:hypothetical protein [Tanacetum cinerariifolium]